jgi:hypothetical protein
MPRCPKCGLDVSPALRVCGACQTSLDAPARAEPAEVRAAGSADSPRRLVKYAVVFIVAWPFLGTWLGLGPTGVFAGWLLGIAALALAAKSTVDWRTEKTIHAPVFGALTARDWKRGKRCYWHGRMAVPGASGPVEVTVSCTDAGPSPAQCELLGTLVRDLPDLKRRALDALTALDRSEWPQAARDAVPELAAIDLEDDEDTKEGTFSLRFESASDPEAEYYVDFRNGGVEGADRLA